MENISWEQIFSQILSTYLISMDPFDPAIHYGPNDAGVSAFSIALVVIGLLVGSWAFGALYGLISNFLKENKKNDDWY